MPIIHRLQHVKVKQLEVPRVLQHFDWLHHVDYFPTTIIDGWCTCTCTSLITAAGAAPPVGPEAADESTL